MRLCMHDTASTLLGFPLPQTAPQYIHAVCESELGCAASGQCWLCVQGETLSWLAACRNVLARRRFEPLWSAGASQWHGCGMGIGTCRPAAAPHAANGLRCPQVETRTAASNCLEAPSRPLQKHCPFCLLIRLLCVPLLMLTAILHTGAGDSAKSLTSNNAQCFRWCNCYVNCCIRCNSAWSPSQERIIPETYHRIA